MEIGMPVSIKPINSEKMIHALAISTPANRSAKGIAMITIGRSAGQRGPGGGTATAAVVIGPPRLRLSPLRSALGPQRGSDSRLGTALRRSWSGLLAIDRPVSHPLSSALTRKSTRAARLGFARLAHGAASLQLIDL